MKRYKAIALLVSLLSIELVYPATSFASSSSIYEQNSYGQNIYQNSSIGHQSDLKIYEVSPYGRIQYHKPHYEIRGNTAYEVNGYGRTQYQNPSLILKK